MSARGANETRRTESAGESTAAGSAGKYVRLFDLASGGMATVSVARAKGAAGFEDIVALKRLHPHLALQPEFRHTFGDEARLASRLHHPNVVRVRDVAEDADGLALVMDYVHGESLAHLWTLAHKAGRALPLGVVIRAILDAAAGLHAVHEMRDLDGRHLRVVHRDVSPANLIVSEHGVCALTDFGIAKYVDSENLTREGIIKGKANYMAPEQVVGHAIDRRTDLFALGVVLYECATMRRLFSGGDPGSVLRHVARCEIPDPRKAIEGFPAPIAEVILKALARKPSDRYATLDEFATALDRARRTIGLTARANEVAAYLDQECGAALRVRREKIAKTMRASAAQGTSAGSDVRLARPTLTAANSNGAAPTVPRATRVPMPAATKKSPALGTPAVAAKSESARPSPLPMRGRTIQTGAGSVPSAAATRPVSAPRSTMLPPPVPAAASKQAPSLRPPPVPPAAVPSASRSVLRSSPPPVPASAKPSITAPAPLAGPAVAPRPRLDPAPAASVPPPAFASAARDVPSIAPCVLSIPPSPAPVPAVASNVLRSPSIASITALEIRFQAMNRFLSEPRKLLAAVGVLAAVLVLSFGIAIAATPHAPVSVHLSAAPAPDSALAHAPVTPAPTAIDDAVPVQTFAPATHTDTAQRAARIRRHRHGRRH